MKVLQREYDEAVMDCCATSGIGQFVADDHPNIEKLILDMESDIEETIGWARDNNKSILVATTSYEQKQACNLLKEAGFKSSVWAVRNHPEYSPKVKLWYKILNP